MENAGFTYVATTMISLMTWNCPSPKFPEKMKVTAELVSALGSFHDRRGGLQSVGFFSGV